MFITSARVAEINKQRKIKKAQEALLNILCTATPDSFKCFIIPEYAEFNSLGHVLSSFTQDQEYLYTMSIEEKFLFISFLIDAFPDLVDSTGNTSYLRQST